jgi:GMP synthase-like glutamine amidotransferase
MRVHYLQHAPFESLGSMEALLRMQGHAISRSALFASPRLPGLADFDALIALGGPMSVNDEGEYPWLMAEKRLVREAVEEGKIVLGLCLGAQLIASALGAKVRKNAEKEIGWFPIEGAAGADAGSFAFPPSLVAFHWHGEVFDLPAGAIRLASSSACENQAFQIGRQTIGLQFHLETTPEAARLLVENCQGDLKTGRYVQSESAILAAPFERYAAIAETLGRLFAYLFDRTDRG